MVIHPDSVDLSKLPSKERKYKYRDWAIVGSEAFLG